MSSPPFPEWLDSGSQPPLVGRRSEREQMNSCWDEVTEGRRQIILIGGEPGIGKSRLVSELAMSARETGATVLGGFCERDYPRPYQPFAHALDALGLEEAGFPGWGSSTQATARHRLFASVADLLTTVAEETVVALILEDLHWARQPTLQLLEYLARHIHKGRLMIVATFRPPPRASATELQDTLVEIHRHPGVTRIDLGGLSLDDITEYLMFELHRSRRDVLETAMTLHDVTGGNPFYLRELWRSTSALTPAEKEGSALEDLPLTVGDAIRSRLAATPPRTMDILAKAAVLGSQIRPDLVSAVYGANARDTAQALDNAAGLGITAKTGRGQYVFNHDLTRQAILDGVSDTDLSGLHEQAATYLSKRPDFVSTNPGTVAHHYASAGGHDDQAARFYELAGDHAELSLAYEDASAHFESAVRHASDPHEVDRLTIRAAENTLKASRFALAAEMFNRVADSADPDFRARGAIGMIEATWRPGRLGHEAAARLVQARRGLGAAEHSAIGVELRCYLALALGYAGSHEAAEEIGASALEDARELGDIKLEAKALLYPTMTSPGFGTELYERVQEAYRLAVASGDVNLIGQAAYIRGSLGYVTGDPEAWTSEMGDLYQVVEQTDEPFHRVALHGLLCSRAFTKGEYEQALGHVDAVFEMAEHFDDDPIVGMEGAQRFMINRETGLDDIRPFITGDRSAEPGSWPLGLLSIYTELGMRDVASELLDELMATESSDQVVARFQGASAAFLSEAVAFTGDRAHAEKLYELLDRRSGTNLIWGHFVMVFGSADRYLGMLADVLGRDASEHFDAALEMDASMGSTQHRAETLARYSVHLRKTDERRALRLAAEANDLGRLMGSSRICRIAEHHDDKPAPDGLTAREIEVLGLVAEGYSNREIAGELFISMNTAANHIKNILIKTGCSNRTQAARYAMDAQLIRR